MTSPCRHSHGDRPCTDGAEPAQTKSLEGTHPDDIAGWLRQDGCYPFRSAPRHATTDHPPLLTSCPAAERAAVRLAPAHPGCVRRLIPRLARGQPTLKSHNRVVPLGIWCRECG